MRTDIFGKIFEKAVNVFLDQLLVEVKSRYSVDDEKKAVDLWKNEKKSDRLTDVIQIAAHGKIWNKISGDQFDKLFKEIFDEAFDLAYTAEQVSWYSKVLVLTF